MTENKYYGHKLQNRFSRKYYFNQLVDLTNHRNQTIRDLTQQP